MTKKKKKKKKEKKENIPPKLRNIKNVAQRIKPIIACYKLWKFYLGEFEFAGGGGGGGGEGKW
jgi:hypothetical protein